MRLFGAYRRAVGKEEIFLELKPQSVVSSLIDKISSEYPELESMVEEMVVSVNGENADRDTPLEKGDEVAVLPTVTGG